MDNIRNSIDDFAGRLEAFDPRPLAGTLRLSVAAGGSASGMPTAQIRSLEVWKALLSAELTSDPQHLLSKP